MSKRKLLLADDSITIQKVVNLTFADEGIDVVAVGDGDAALARIASEIPDILLADVNMPGPTGYEICEHLRANEATRGVPVILLVGSFEPFDEAEATRVGANAYLTKPFQSIKQLVQQVNQLIDSARPAEQEPSSASAVEEPTPGERSPVVGEPVAIAPAGYTSSDPAPKNFDDLGYETAESVAEASSSAAPAPDDIDTLYERSVAGAANDDLSDVGIDDEMIETSYSAPQANDELAAFAPESARAVEPMTPRTEAETAAYEIQPSGIEVVADQESSSPASSAPAIQPEPDSDLGFRSGYEQRFPDDPSKFENTITYENWKPADMREGSGGSPEAGHGSSGTLGPLDTAPLNEVSPQPIEAVSQSPTVGEDTIRMEGRFDTTGTSFKFDDVDLLDLSVGAPVEITSPSKAIEQGGSKQVVTISSELIEMIAQRVVEKLSEKY